MEGRQKVPIRQMAIVLVIVLFTALSAGNGTAQVAGGKHDLSYFGGSNFKFATAEVCVFCHTPHSANSNQTYSPTNPTTPGGAGGLNGEFIWNRSLPSTTWQLYGSDTMEHTVSGPGPLSLMCLSCHDGVGALNVLVNNPLGGEPGPWIGVTMNQFGDAPSDVNIGPINIGDAVCDGGLGYTCTTPGDNLQNDHPIGFTYGGSAVDTGLKDLGSLPLELQSRMALTNNRMECSTCHDPHRTNAPGEKNMFLVMTDNAGSQLCFGCHAK